MTDEKLKLINQLEHDLKKLMGDLGYTLATIEDMRREEQKERQLRDEQRRDN